MFNRYQRPRPNAANPGGFLPQPPADPALPGQLRAEYKPEFTSHSSASEPAERSDTPPPARSSITSSYDQARAELANPAAFGRPMTEKQTRELKWQQRQDPMGYRDQLTQNQRTYGVPPAPQQTPKSTPVRPTNFNGPRGRFTS